ncbi:hypothetical protein Bpfe_014873 [Biomphalaria pfeifferi]|uniref:Uncharacterized protein n=1 Tax=Biomphalaria pfeifferi TaxID=112525 RepID=A0AAD8BKA3_BIOPF|nr:hypothetical protein Bpfe_014873 [Biomphalaria pfeifferi]
MIFPTPFNNKILDTPYLQPSPFIFKPYQEKISQFKDESKKLFDNCSCKCCFISQCQCEMSRKKPAIERDFLEDQRDPRGMIIAKVDEAESIKLQKQYIRKELKQRAEVSQI